LDFDRCTPQKAEYLRNQCHSLSQACFREKSYEAQVFHDLVCEPIKCVHGVFQGSIRPSSDATTSLVLFSILKLVAVGVIFLIAIIHSKLYFSHNCIVYRVFIVIFCDSLCGRNSDLIHHQTSVLPCAQVYQ